MSFYSVTQAQATTNKVKNPSAEDTANYAEMGSVPLPTITRVRTTARFGDWCWKIDGGSGDGIELQTATLTNAAHIITFYADNYTAGTVIINGQSYTPALLASGRTFNRYGIAIAAADCNAQVEFSITNGAEAVWYLDGVQIELGSTSTDYCDGDQPGCLWSG